MGYTCQGNEDLKGWAVSIFAGMSVLHVSGNGILCGTTFLSTATGRHGYGRLSGGDSPTCAGARVLDVGSGSGFLSAVMGLLVLPGGHVTGVEKVTDLAQRSVQSIQVARSPPPPPLPPAYHTSS